MYPGGRGVWILNRYWKELTGKLQNWRYTFKNDSPTCHREMIIAIRWKRKKKTCFSYSAIHNIHDQQLDFTVLFGTVLQWPSKLCWVTTTTIPGHCPWCLWLMGDGTPNPEGHRFPLPDLRPCISEKGVVVHKSLPLIWVVPLPAIWRD